MESIHAGGAKEDQIQTARKYIAEKRYDEALKILAEAIKNNPEDRDAAVELNRQILAMMGGYNEVLSQLYDVLKNDKGNYNKALELINQAAGINPNPSLNIKNQLENFRITAKLNKIRFDKDQIMAAALAQIQAKDYVGAIDSYLGGFPLAEGDFKLGSQTAEFRTAVLDRTSQVRGAVTTLKAQNALLVPSLQSFTAAIKVGRGGLDQLNAQFPGFAAQFLQTVSQTVALEQSADTMTELRQRSDREYPSSDPSPTSNYNYNEYIRIIQEFMHGPAGKTGQGIKYAARSLIDSEYRDTLAGLSELYAARKQEVEALSSGNGEADLAEPGRLLQLAGIILLRAEGLQANIDLGSTPSFADIKTRLTAPYRPGPALILGELRSYQQLLADTRLAATLRRIKASKSPTLYQEALSAWDGAVADLAAWEKDVRAGLDAGLLDEAQYQRLRAVFLASHDQSQTALLALAREHYSGVVQSQLAQVRNLFTLAAADEKKADGLLAGVSLPGQTGLYRYPDQAVTAYNLVKTRYLAQLNSLDLLDKDMGGTRKEIGGYKPVQDNQAASGGLRREIAAAITRLDGNVSKAQANLKAAQDNVQQAVQAMGLADAAIAGARPDLGAADRNYTQAGDLYVAAFSLAYNADQRLLADNRLNALHDRIETARNNEYNRQIRELITATKGQFDREEFQRAFDTITQAEELDDQTAAYKNAILAGAKPDDARNAEIRYWKNRIQAATNLSSERTISEADPTFNALSNYLNLAQIDFNRISTQVAAGLKADAALVKRAKQNIENVLLVKPNNAEAKLLRLRVEQIADPATFKSLLPNRVREAVARARKEATVGSLTELQALKELDPGNASLKQAIFDLEVALGYRDSPLTTAKKNEAANNVAQARQLANSSRQADLQRAVSLLNQAFKLNPENADIGPLLDGVRSKLKSAEARLTFEEEQKLNEARAQYLAGQLFAARTTVKAMLDNHPTYAPLIKLLGQIDQQLGQ